MEFDKEKFKDMMLTRLRQQYGKDLTGANRHDLYDAVVAENRVNSNDIQPDCEAGIWL